MIKDNKPYRILVVEDNPVDSVLVEEFLKEQISDPFLLHAGNFKEAVAIMTADTLINVILLDLTLPDKSGLSLITGMMQIAVCPIIILSGYADIDFSIKSIALGILDYVLKDDLNGTVLYKSITYAIERRKIILEMKESEQRYSDLFHFSPQPMWVFELDTSCFLDINDAATVDYGYSREEFLSMTTGEIAAKEDIYALAGHNPKSRDNEKSFLQDVVIHQKKDGELIYVNLQSNLVSFKGKKAVLVLAKNITERIKYINAIKNQNEKLREIAWAQSHVVRAPLARMMAIVNLIKELKIASPECEDLLHHFSESGQELDAIIKDIAEKTACIKIN